MLVTFFLARVTVQIKVMKKQSARRRWSFPPQEGAADPSGRDRLLTNKLKPQTKADASNFKKSALFCLQFKNDVRSYKFEDAEE